MQWVRKAALALFCAATMLSAVPSGEPAHSQNVAPPSPQIKQAPPTPIAQQKVELEGQNPWNPAWDLMIERSLPHELLTRQRAGAVASLCPRFGTMTLANRRTFWAYFFQALAAAEASLKPTADVKHNDRQVAVTDTVTRRTVRQEGLLQLTYMDSRRYGCAFNWEHDKNLPPGHPAKTILQPANNLMCGIRILHNQLVAQHKPLLADSSYWVTLRPGTVSFQLFLKQMANVPAACASKLGHDKPDSPSLPPAAEAQLAPVAASGR